MRMRNRDSLFFDFHYVFFGHFAIFCLVFDLFSYFEFFQDLFLDGDFCNTFLVGLGLVGFLVEFELDYLALYLLAVDF